LSSQLILALRRNRRFRPAPANARAARADSASAAQTPSEIAAEGTRSVSFSATMTLRRRFKKTTSPTRSSDATRQRVSGIGG
jgi:hypothetical protein